jgi:hypothetical protein
MKWEEAKDYAKDEKNNRLAIIRRLIQAGDKEIARLKADIQEMVTKAADKHLEGYREMGNKIAEQEEEIARLKRGNYAYIAGYEKGLEDAIEAVDNAPVHKSTEAIRALKEDV